MRRDVTDGERGKEFFRERCDVRDSATGNVLDGERRDFTDRGRGNGPVGRDDVTDNVRGKVVVRE